MYALSALRRLAHPPEVGEIQADYCRETSNQLIVYHPPSHAIQVVPHPRNAPSNSTPVRHLSILPNVEHDKAAPSTSSQPCPLCGQERPQTSDALGDTLLKAADSPPAEGHYFRVLERAHESSRPGTPVSSSEDRFTHSQSTTPVGTSHLPGDDASDLPAMGYYRRFFKEERRLGIGAEGSVFLATHVIGGNILGRLIDSQVTDTGQVPTL